MVIPIRLSITEVIAIPLLQYLIPSASNFATSVQSYGFTITLPDGVTASITSSLGNGASATFFDGSNVSEPTIDGYLITETLGSPAVLPAPSGGAIVPMVTIQMSIPTVGGTISILANDSALAAVVPPLKCFMSADMIDDSTALFPNVIDPNGSGLSGTTSYSFSTLGLESNDLDAMTVYPNPISTFVTISGVRNMQAVEVYNLTGQRVMYVNAAIEQLDFSALQSGVYLLKVQATSGSKTLKVVKE